MRTGVIERRMPMMHVPTAHPGSAAVPVLADVHWTPATPWTVRIGFPGDCGKVVWDFGLDLLAAGLVQQEKAREGPMLVWSYGERRDATILSQDTAGQAEWLEARTSDLAEFLADALRTMAIRTARA